MNFLIIGASAAGISAAKVLRKMDQDSTITIISIDKHIYSRCLIHKFISKEKDIKGISFVPQNFIEDNNINWINGKSVVKLIDNQKKVVLDDGTECEYDKLLIASGANYFIPPIDNFKTANNVYGFRDLEDTLAIDKVADKNKHFVVVGAGLVGLDIAHGLLARDCKVTVLEMANRVVPLQADEISGKRYQDLFEKAGCNFKLGVSAKTSKIDANNNITHIILSNEEEIDCDFVIVCTGIRPAISFLQDSNIKIDKGIVVDDYLKTSIDDVYAAGDVTGLSGIWSSASTQGELAAANMCGEQSPYTDRYCSKNAMNFYGLTMLSVGDIYAKDDGSKEVVLQDDKIYKKAIIKGNIMTGIQLQGNIANSGIWQDLIKRKIELPVTDEKIFSLSFKNFYNILPDGECSYEISLN